MKFLLVHPLEIQLEYCGKEYFVSRFFIIYNYNLCKLEHPIGDIDGNGILWSYPLLSSCLINKPIGLFRFDDIEGYIDCISLDENEVINIRLGDYFYIRTHFFVLEG